MKSDDPRRDFDPDTPEDDEVEILEVVGVDLDLPLVVRAPLGPDLEPHEVDLAFDQEDPAAPPGGASQVASARAERAADERLSDREQLLRIRADYENLMRRLDRERFDYEQHANSTLVSRLLPVLDNFERALSADPRTSERNSFRSGVELIYKHLLDELRKEGLEPIPAVGRPFDPTLHDAVATGHAPPQQDNTVVGELQRGYVFRDRVLRPALVKVGLSSADRPPDDTGEGR